MRWPHSARYPSQGRALKTALLSERSDLCERLGPPHMRSLHFTALGTQRAQLVEDLRARNALATCARSIRFQNGAAKGEAFVLREDGCADRFISVRELAGADIFLDRFPEIGRKVVDDVGLLHGVQSTNFATTVKGCLYPITPPEAFRRVRREETPPAGPPAAGPMSCAAG